jgi:Na+/H+ antiporter NhaA
MSEELLRDRLSIFLLGGQIAIPVVVLLAYLNDGFTREEWAQINEIVLPMVAAFGGFAITHIVRSRVRNKKKYGKQLTRLFVATAVALPVFFLSSISLVIVLKAYNIGMRNFDDLKEILATLNTLFGATSGTLLASLFEKE